MKIGMKLFLASLCLLPAAVTTALAATNIIQVFNFDYGAAPSTHIDPTINVGDTVEWVWTNGTHSTAAAAGQSVNWDSGVQSTPFTFDHTFTQLGTFNYYCALHGFDAGGGQVGGMSGFIHVVMPAHDVRTYIAASKGQLFDQHDANTLTMSDTGFVFIATVRGSSSNTVLSATDQTPGGTTKVLAKESPDSDIFRFKEFFSDKPALDAAYTNGTYTMTIATADDGTLTPSLDLPGDSYPNTPQIVNLSAVQTIGVSSNFAIVWAPFSGGTSNDLVRFEIDDTSGHAVTNSPELGEPGQLDGTATSFLIAAGTLATDVTNTGTVEFVKITARDAGSVLGATGITAYIETTQFPIGTFAPSAVSCSLVPALATNRVGTTHRVTSTITTNGAPVAGVTADFNVISGPNSGTNGSGVTDGAGQAAFSYSGSETGTDTIQVSGMINSLSFTCAATKVWLATGVNDLAVISVKAPKTIALTAKKTSQTRSVRVTIQNRGDHDESLASVDMLSRMVTLALESAGTNCVAPRAQLFAGLPPGPLPVALKPKRKLNVIFRVIFDCGSGPLMRPSHVVFRYVATVHHEAIDGQPDSHPVDDTCPRDALPGGVDPYPDGKIQDNGCGGKKPDGTRGAPVITDVVIR